MGHNWEPLTREEVIKAVERKNPPRIPLVMAKWWGEGLEDFYGQRLHDLDIYSDDVELLLIEPLPYRNMNLSWSFTEGGAKDSACILADWDRLDEFIENFPDPEHDPQIEALAQRAESLRAAGRYVMVGWWRLFFERPWEIRGMTNLLLDYYTFPAQIHHLHEALCDHYCRLLRRIGRELHPDGFWTSDDLGHQTQLFMRPATFREFLKPYYARVGRVLEELGMHWWLHSCGNNTQVLDDLIEVGVDVFHPVQKGTMDEWAVASRYGDRLTFLAGIDVQHILQEKSVQGVRDEVRFLIDTFDRPGGGLCLAAGNGIVPPTPLENIAAFLDEALCYGAEHRRRFNHRKT